MMKTLPQILCKPLLMAMVTALGLVAALVSDQAGDVAAWICLAYVVAVGVGHALPRRRFARSAGDSKPTDDAC